MSVQRVGRASARIQVETPLHEGGDWDAVIVGASFAGLAAAIELSGAGRVLVLDRAKVGEGETSACATPLRVLERLQALEAVEQVHREVIFHFPDGRERRYRPAFPFATFDYRRLCELLAARTDATFLRATVDGCNPDGDLVVSSAGSFRGRVLIDASGWRAVLGSSLRPGLVERRAMSLGLEQRIDRCEQGLHFWVFPRELRSWAGFSRLATIAAPGSRAIAAMVDSSARFGTFSPAIQACPVLPQLPAVALLDEGADLVHAVAGPKELGVGRSDLLPLSACACTDLRSI